MNYKISQEQLSQINVVLQELPFKWGSTIFSILNGLPPILENKKPIKNIEDKKEKPNPKPDEKK